MNVPGLPGRWSIWSLCGEAPGARFVVPADDPARGTGIKYAVVRVTQKAAEAFPTVELLRTDPPLNQNRTSA